jgi:uncharacterized protein (TIGR02466 family)
MIAVKELQPFVNSIYQVDELLLNIGPIKSSVQTMLTDSTLWKPTASGGHQTHDLSEVFDDSYFELLSIVGTLASQIGKSWNITQPLELISYWTNIKHDKHFGVSHLHPNSIISGVFYVSVPSGSGGITFERPDNQELCFRVIEPNTYSCKHFTVESKENMLLLFPSFMRHRIEVNKFQNTNDKRISISFNYGVSI